MRAVNRYLKRCLNWWAWSGVLALFLICAMTAIAFVVFAPEPIAIRDQARPPLVQQRHLAQTHQVLQLSAQRPESKRRAVKVEDRPQSLQHHLIAIRQQLDRLGLMLTVLVGIIAGALGGGLIAALLNLLLTRRRSPLPPPLSF